MSDVVQKLWGYCHTLRHDGIDYGDYIEQLTYLLFLKMANERSLKLPKDCGWQTLKENNSLNLTKHYTAVLSKLSSKKGLLGDIFFEAQSRFSKPVNLEKLISLIDEIEWTKLDIDVKAQAFEGLLQRAASEGKKGAGQYFTPRPLIKSIVRCIKPDPRTQADFSISDPACGSGGFLVVAYEWLMEITKNGAAINSEDYKRIRKSTYFGQELVQRPRRLALMNLYLHGLMPIITLGDTIYDPPGKRKYDVILTNPPFGTKGANEAPSRKGFKVETSNKQLNFVQHIVTVLKDGGRAAVVLPDNCLFENKAGEVFADLLGRCNVHTLLRLPRGTFSPYSNGVKANVIFLQKGMPTKTVWIYDARSNISSVTGKERMLTEAHFAGFEQCYGKDPNGKSKREDGAEENRFRKFHISEIKARDYKLDITWLKDELLEDAETLPEPQDLASEAITELEAVVADLREIIALIEKEETVAVKSV